mgnify:CR=1 FL=1
MGTFLGYFGDITIPEDKQEEFTQRVLTILDQGGMMELEEVCIFGKQVWLMKPLQIQPGEEQVLFQYNYFENDFWETAGYRPETCSFFTGKVGCRQFDRVCSAVYVLYEFYSDTFGIANQNGLIYSARAIIGWLNHLFQEHYNNGRVSNPWRIYQLLPKDCSQDDLLALVPHDASMDVIGMLIYLFVTRNRHAADWKQLLKELCCKSDAISIVDCITVSENFLKNLRTPTEEDKLQVLEQLTSVLKKKTQKPSAQVPQTYFFFARLASLLPVEVTAKLMADAFSLDFQSLLEELQPYAQDVRSIWNFGDCQPAEPVPPMETALFLGCSDDDRAWWWKPDGDVHFSEDMIAWLSQCRKELDTLARQYPLPHGVDFLKQLMETLSDIQQRHGYVFAFQKMFYNFMIHTESPMVQAAVLFLRLLSEQDGNEADITTRLRRYLAVLGNLPLRKAVFGF